MGKDLDWNEALLNTEDLSALQSSEIFRNYIKIALNREREEKLAENKKKQEFQKFSDLLESANPVLRNLDYGENKVDYGTEKEIKIEDIKPVDVDEEIFDELRVKASVEPTMSESEIRKFMNCVDNINADLVIQADMQYEANLKEEQLDRCERSLGLDENIYYQLLKAEDNK